MKKLIGVLVIAMFVLIGCTNKEACQSDKSCKTGKSECAMESKAHKCGPECADGCKMEKQAHVCGPECADGCKMEKQAHVCGPECADGCKMNKEAHVCTDACGADCPHKVKSDMDTEGHEEEPQDGAEDKD